MQPIALSRKTFATNRNNFCNFCNSLGWIFELLGRLKLCYFAHHRATA
jgi:hypothetical protein